MATWTTALHAQNTPSAGPGILPAAVELQSERYLHTEGRQLKDRLGRAVLLKGVNLGGWLVSEGWMNGRIDSPDRWAQEQLEARFGNERAARLMAAWQNNWITVADLDSLQRNGYNLLRVPFGYRNLQSADGKWMTDRQGNVDFSRFDWIVREAGRRNMYVIFDLHIWPGQREDYHLISRVGPASDAARAQAAALWSALARHFKGVGTIAGFDLVNEPEGSPGDLLQSVLYEAVRAQDAERIVINESSAYANYGNAYWQNVVWSAHYPTRSGGGEPEAQIRAWEQENGIAAHPDIQVPILMGEIKAPDDNAASAAALAAALSTRGYHWAVWTYKGVDIGGWAAFNYHSTVRYNLKTDSYATLYRQWTQGLTAWQDPSQPASHYLNDWWFDGFR